MKIFRIFIYLKLIFFINSLFLSKKNIKKDIYKKFHYITRKKFSLATSQLRVGFYLVLKYLKFTFPKKKEIIVNSYNLAEMVNICKNLNLKTIYPKLNENLSFSVNDLEKKINNKTLAVVATNIFNNQNDLIKVRKICKNKKVPFIEDNAIYFGNFYMRNKTKVFAGSFGDYTLHSFNIMKNISAMYGGLVSTNDKIFFDYANQEMSKFKRFPYSKYLNQCVTFFILKLLSIKYIYKFFFFPLSKFAHKQNLIFYLKLLYPSLKFKKSPIPNNYLTHINNFSLNLIWFQLRDMKYLDNLQKIKSKNNLLYYKELKKKNIKDLKLIKIKSPSFQNFNDFPIIVKRKKELLKYLLDNGIETKLIQYVDCQKIFNDGYKNTSQIFEDKILCLPNHVKINEKYIKFVTSLIEKFYKKI